MATFNLLSQGLPKSMRDYFKLIYEDYKGSLMEVKDGIINKPGKTALLSAVLGGAIYLVESNPNERCFFDQVITSQNDLIEVGDQVRNQSSLDHVLFLNQCLKERTLSRLNLGFLSLLVQLDLDPQCALYVNQCKYLKPSYKSYVTERLVDVGIAGKWRLLDHKMLNYDVNPDEWSDTT